MNSKKRRAIEPIRYDELMSNAGMSGFVSFLELPTTRQVPVPQAPQDSLAGAESTVRAAAALAHGHPAERTKIVRQSRIRRAAQVEDGHSLAEQAVYDALWGAALPLSQEADADRAIRIGYHRLGQMTRLSWVSVKANLRTLEKKLAIAVTGSENSATREGKCYLVYSRSSILDRRRHAGLEWVRRTRGVELLSHAEVVSGRPGPKPVI